LKAAAWGAVDRGELVVIVSTAGAGPEHAGHRPRGSSGSRITSQNLHYVNFDWAANF
jgi:hypothetical protein